MLAAQGGGVQSSNQTQKQRSRTLHQTIKTFYATLFLKLFDGIIKTPIFSTPPSLPSNSIVCIFVCSGLCK